MSTTTNPYDFTLAEHLNRDGDLSALGDHQETLARAVAYDIPRGILRGVRERPPIDLALDDPIRPLMEAVHRGHLAHDRWNQELLDSPELQAAVTAVLPPETIAHWTFSATLDDFLRDGGDPMTLPHIEVLTYDVLVTSVLEPTPIAWLNQRVDHLAEQVATLPGTWELIRDLEYARWKRDLIVDRGLRERFKSRIAPKLAASCSSAVFDHLHPRFPTGTIVLGRVELAGEGGLAVEIGKDPDGDLHMLAYRNGSPVAVEEVSEWFEPLHVADGAGTAAA